MKLKHLLLGAALAGAASMNAATFDWKVTNLSPSDSDPIRQLWQLSELSFLCYGQTGLQATDVMPMWIDEDGNEIVAKEGGLDPWALGDPKYTYEFDLEGFTANGDYTLVIPEGTLVNGAGELSAAKEFYYTLDVEELKAGMFEDFKVLDITPDFGQPQALWNDKMVSIDTNHNDAIGYATLIVTDLNPEFAEEANVITSTNFNMNRQLGDKSPVSWEVAGLFKFYKGHEYQAVFTFYNGVAEKIDGVPTQVVERLKYNFTGTVEPYHYSDIVLVGVSPAPYDIVISEPEQAVFTYTFSGPVNLYKAEIPLGPLGSDVFWPEWITSNEDKTVWTVDASQAPTILSSDASVIINIYARDLDGNQLRGDMGYETDAYYTFTYACSVAAPKIEITTPAQGAALSELTQVVVKSVNGEPITRSWSNRAFIAVKGNKNPLYVLETPAKWEKVTEMVFTEWKNSAGVVEPIHLTTPGAYYVMIEDAYFTQGEEYDTKMTSATSNAFTITTGASSAQNTLMPVEVTPANNSFIEKFEEAYITFGETIDLLNYRGSLLNSKGEEVAELIIESVWDEEGATINVFPHDDITAPGTYYMVIPEKTVCNIAYSNSKGEEGLYNPELRYEYVVRGGEASDGLKLVAVDPAEGKVSQLYVLTLTFNAWADLVDPVGGGFAYLKNQAGETVAEATVVVDWDNETGLDMLVKFSAPFTTAGEYVLTIPAGTIVANDNAEDVYGEINLHYTIDTQSSVAAIVANGNVTVCDLQGRVVIRNASADQISKLQKGIYIIDGKKVVR